MQIKKHKSVFFTSLQSLSTVESQTIPQHSGRKDDRLGSRPCLFGANIVTLRMDKTQYMP